MGDVRQEFDDAFEVQRAQSNRLASVERSTDNFDEIVAERATLDDLRSKTRTAKAKVVSRFEPPATTHVEQPLGPQDTSRIGKVGATIGCVLSLAALAVVWFGIIQPFSNPYPVDIDGVTNEQIDVDAPCLWSFDVAMTNGFDEPITIESVEIVLKRRKVSGFFDPVTIASGTSGTVPVSFRAGTAARCPSVREIDHGTLTVTTNPGGPVSHKF